ncbi:MAG: V-type ATP synthase subunit F, partial [Acidobacteriota bacterium]
MFSQARVAIVGDADLVFGFRGLGFGIFSPRTDQEAGSVLSRLVQERFALCFVHH